MKSGVYAIVLVADGRRYVGSGIDVHRRWREHQTHLRAGIHCNRYLSNAWGKYGSEAFRFEILEFCPIDDLISCEQKHIDAQADFNLSMTAGSQLGMIHSVEARKKISDAAKIRMSDPAYKAMATARLKAPEVRARMVASVKAAMQDPLVLAKISAATSASNKRRMSDPEFKAKTQAASKTTQALAKMSATQKRRLQDQSVRDVLSTATKRYFAENPTARARVGAEAKSRMTDPVYMAKFRATMVARGHWKS